MNIHIVLLTSFLVSNVWPENTDIFDEDFINPSDMLYYDAASQTMRAAKQRKINALLKQYIKRTLNNAENIGLHATDEDAQYQAEITLSSQIVRDFLKCIKESDCDATILETHLENIQIRLKLEDGNNSELPETFPMVFDRVLEVAIIFFILVGFLDLVKNFTLPEWLVCVFALVCKYYWAYDFKDFTGFLYQWNNTGEDISVIMYLIILRITVTLTLKLLKTFFHRKQHLQVQDGPQNLEDNLCYGVQEVPVENVIDERLEVERNQKPASSRSPERPQGRLKSKTAGFKNSKNEEEQLQQQPFEDSLAETSNSIEISGSLSFVVIEEQKDS